MILRNPLRRWARFLPPQKKGDCEVYLADAAARSHVGRVRQINEDRFLVCSERNLWAVADGMGGHVAGGEAAEAVIQELARLADDTALISNAAIHDALDRANHRIHAANGESVRSGTTVVVAWVAQGELTVIWAGDSRAYLIRNGDTRCLTRDHSMVQELVDAGAVTQSEAKRHPQANVITRALGVFEFVTADQITVSLRSGDLLLLCSDGVSRSLDLARLPLQNRPIGQFADALMSNALQCDGTDNATVIVVAPCTSFQNR